MAESRGLLVIARSTIRALSHILGREVDQSNSSLVIAVVVVDASLLDVPAIFLGSFQVPVTRDT